ncbi:MAG: insulinase family protein [Ruminococcus sp.]|nr:insulinase family protein [Ruminococcus sp.]
MALEYNRETICDKIALTVVRDDKFKSCSVSVVFRKKLSEETATVYALLPALITNTNSKYPDTTAFNQKLASLYGARISGFTSKISDFHFISLNCNSIRNEYALNGENLLADSCQMLLDCIFDPVIEDGGFAKKEFSIRKKEHIEYIESLINDKRGYAIKQAYETVFENEPFSVNSNGTVERAEKLDTVNSYEVYKELLKTAPIEIFVIGGGDLSEAVKLVKEKFAKIERNADEVSEFKCFSPVKNEVADVVEPMEVNQSKMVMAFKSDCDEMYVCKLMTALLGGSAFSLLFTNVREKLSLCYYCAARYVDGKGALVIDSGVDLKNIELAKKAITEQLEDIAKGNFTDELLDNTKLLLKGVLRSAFDSIGGITSWYLNNVIKGVDYNPEQVMDIYDKISREQIIECAKSFKLDTVYLLESKSQKAEEV